MPIWLRYAIAAVVVALDQWSKLAIEASALELYDKVRVTSFFNITKAYNPGAAFSFLADSGGWQRWFFTIVSAVVSVVLTVWLARMARAERMLALAISLILGGAVGNLIDRVAYGHVVDFIQVHAGGRYFPSFNLADSAITGGTALLLLLTVLDWRAESRAARAEREAGPDGRTVDARESE